MKKSKLIRWLAGALLISVNVLVVGCVDRESPAFKEKANASNERSTASTNRAITESQQLQLLDKVCRDIPYFRETTPSVKALSKDRSTLFYYYQINESAETLFPAVKEFFSQSGWNFSKESKGFWEYQIEFERNEYWIQITHGRFGEANYATNCRIK